MTRKETATKILYEKGLHHELSKYGKPHIIGSYYMDMMVCNDLDIDIESDSMTLEKLYSLTNYILTTFHPTWYEAREEVNDEGKTVWFHGFHSIIDNQVWNFDLWFFDKETIQKAENFCSNITQQCQQNLSLKTTIIQLKKTLLQKNLYRYDKYTSMDVYNAVLCEGITNVNTFLNKHPLPPHILKESNPLDY